MEVPGVAAAQMISVAEDSGGVWWVYLCGSSLWVDGMRVYGRSSAAVSFSNREGGGSSLGADWNRSALKSDCTVSGMGGMGGASAWGRTVLK